MKRIIGLLLIMISGSLWSQNDDSGNFPPPDYPVEIQVKRASGKITLDGIPDEPSWEAVEVIDDFFRREPRQEVISNTKPRFVSSTTIRICMSQPTV